MKYNEYMENIDKLMKFVFEGRLLGVDAQAERRRLQELKSYGILEEDNDICKCYKQIINLLNDLNALERKIDLNIKKQERQEFYQGRISTLDEELAVDRLDIGYNSKSLKRTLKK